jgi:hypothetical protein
VPPGDGGYALAAEVLQGDKVIDRQDADVFCVADSPFLCAIQPIGGMPLCGPGAHHLGLKGYKDEVLGKWVRTRDAWVLELHMMAQGGLPIFGTASMRQRIFRYYRPLVLDAIATADARLLAKHPDLAHAEVIAHFHWRRGRVETESWGRLSDWM